MAHDFGAFGSLTEAEQKLRQATHGDHAAAINSHADALEALNAHHAELHTAVLKLRDQMDAVLDSLYQITTRLDRLDTVEPVIHELRAQVHRTHAQVVALEEQTHGEH